MTPRGRPPFYPRLRGRLEGGAQPLLRLHGWPAGGGHALLRALALEHPTKCRWLEPKAESWDEALSGGEPYLLAAWEPSPQTLLQWLDRLGEGRRLLFAAHRRRLDEVLPEQVVDPAALRLTAAETAELFAGAAVGRVGELLEFTDGWYGPLAVLRSHWPEGGGSAEAVAARPEVRRELEQQVLDPLPESLRRLLRRLVLVDTLEPELWYPALKRSLEDLSSFTELLHGHRLVVGAPPRLPRLLRLLVEPEHDPVVRRETLSHLGLAAAALDRIQEAAAFFEAAGDEERRRRVAGRQAREDEPVKVAKSPRTIAPRYSLHLLGHPAVYRPGPDGEVELPWRLRRAFLTVAFLGLARDRRASKDELIAALWPDVSQAALEKNFHPTLSEARRTLGGAGTILFRQGLYRLHPEIVWEIDVRRFEELVERGEDLGGGVSDSDQEAALEAWQGAWRLYRGPLLAGIEGAWLQGERRRLRALHLDLLRRLGELASALGRHTLALDALRSVLLEEPFEEQVHLAVMELYARQGRRDLVRRQYVRLQEHLLDELKVEPSASIRERYLRLMG